MNNLFFLSLDDSVKFGVLDILRSIGISVINIVYRTIDVLYEIAGKINSLNFIEMLKNIDNSVFVTIFNSFFALSFFVLFLFSVWKVTFRIIDADEIEQSMGFVVKEIFKCSFLIFSTYFIFNTTINLGSYLSTAIYNSFTTENSTIGDKMKTAYLTTNESCYLKDNNNSSKSVDDDNVKNLKNYLSSYTNLSSVNTMKDFEKLIRDGNLTSTNIIDSGAFNYTCQIYVPGIWNDSQDYAFSYNFLFGIIAGGVFLFAIGFAVLMLGKRQIELAFLMMISPLVFATSVCRKEQRSALYQQLASLILQGGALILLIGLTSLMFNAIQNASELNSLQYYTKTVAQTVLYLGCAMMLMVGSTSLNRFIGENVSANSGRDTIMAMRGMANGVNIIGRGLSGGTNAVKGATQIARGTGKMATGLATGLASTNPSLKTAISNRMNSKLQKGQSKIDRGNKLKNSDNLLSRAYGSMLSKRGQSIVDTANKQWDFGNNRFNPNYMKEGFNQTKVGLFNIKNGLSTIIGSPSSYANYRRNYPRTNLYNTKGRNDKI